MINKKIRKEAKNYNTGIFRGRLFIGLVIIILGIFIVFFIPNNIFFYIAIILLIAISILGIIEIYGVLWNSLYKIFIGDKGNESKFRTEKLIFATGIFFIYFVVAIILFGILVLGDHGQNWFLLILAPPGIFDGIAFISGKKVGKHKILVLKNVSPNKTWEGTFCGFIACFCLTMIILEFKFSYLAYWQTALISLVIPVCAFFGDLIESKFKRIMQTKDSGRILRGHGGLLDRFDSQLLAIYGISALFFFWFL